MLNTIIVSSTEARKKLFEIINQVYFGGEEVVVTKNKKPLVRIIKETNDYNPPSLINLHPTFKLKKPLTKKQAIKMFKEVKESYE
ncbi:MAG: type II toxin-antitoxin system Phd/YefM family antitoxin [Microgenomates group bacterium]